VVAKQSTPARTVAVANSNPPTIVPPTKLSFASIMSGQLGQLVGDLFHLY
jgi:hypothetical protein